MADDAKGTPQQPERPKLRIAAPPTGEAKPSPSETIKVPPPTGATAQRPAFGTLKPGGASPSTADGRPRITLASGAPAEPPAVLSETATMKKKESVTLPRPLASGSLPTMAGQVAPGTVPDTAKMKKKEAVILEPGTEAAPPPPTESSEAAPPPPSRLGPPKVVPDTARLTKKSSVVIEGGASTDNEVTVRANMSATSQMPAVPAPPPDTARLVRRKAEGAAADASRPSAAEAEAQTVQSLKQTAEIVDPNMRRQTDTASLRRIVPKPQMAADGGPATPNPEESTETIHLKVIKEKKNQLKNILSASQTIRLRPQAPESSAPAETAPAMPAPISPPPPSESGDPSAGKKTLKIKAPESGIPAGDDTRTSNLSRSMSVVQKMRGDAPAATTTPPVPEAPSATQEGQGLHNPKSTLKIKAPPSSGQTQAAPAAPDAGQSLDPNQKKSTLKIKAPAAGGAATVTAPAPAGATAAAPTEAPKAGKTLKLRPAAAKPGETMTAAPAPGAGSTMAAPAPAVEAESATASQPDAQDAPGVLYTLGAAATLVVGATLLYLLISQAGSL